MNWNSISRRRFINLATTFGALAVLPGTLIRKAMGQASDQTARLVSVENTDYYKAAVDAVKALGGISEFVSPGDKVGLLINGNFSNPGTFSHPDISLAVLKMCFDAEAADVMLIRADNEDVWKKSAHYASHKELLDKTSRSQGNKVFAIDNGVILKEAEMIREIKELDALINIPVSKHHNAAFLTCCLKNMMGLCTRSTNVLFHSHNGKPPTDNERLAQCIADINTLRKPDLNIVDATAFIINNGPHGPGEILEKNTVLAGTDPVALDAYCATFLDYEPGMVLSTDFAEAHKLGTADLRNIKVSKIHPDQTI